MRERPILFSAPMVRAILEGRKTQTRRIAKVPPHQAADRPLKHQPKHPGPYFDSYCSQRKDALNPRGMSNEWCWWTADDRPDPLTTIRCPYGAPGDRLWVRETFSSERQEQAGTGAVRWVVIGSGGFSERCGAYYRATYDPSAASARRWKPAIHMPRCLSRISLEVTGVRVERLHDISEEDAKAEGVRPFFEVYDCIGRDQRICSGELARDAEHRASFACLWDEINGDRVLWNANPWVWVVEFRRVGVITVPEIEAALHKGARERVAAERTIKRSPRR